MCIDYYFFFIKKRLDYLFFYLNHPFLIFNAIQLVSMHQNTNATEHCDYSSDSVGRGNWVVKYNG